MLLRNTFRAFRHRDYFIFWCGLFLGHTERWSKPRPTVGSFFSSLTRRFTWAWRGFASAFRGLSFRLLGGAIVDRANRKILFVVTQTAFLLMALFLGVMDYLGTIRVWHVLSISALTGFFVSFEQPVRQSILHQLVPRSELPNAVTLYQMVFKWIDALRTVDRRSADSLYRYQRLLFRRDNWKRIRASYNLYDSHRRNSTTDKQSHRVVRYGRKVGFGMEHPGSFIPLHCPRNRHFLHQAVH
jgi:Transmembrane secretion effector